ncbi:hypothetical protein GGX14DRAFT_471720 [Mycena pura]|uniref:Uncharacterized protein n=1 Tax=Mycena pura TaxID=153505 RepID=A0AAD6UZQ2_9AGAR|nr:hypothetical protein GGX14DRAFT_471720 [Mycena pura]
MAPAKKAPSADADDVLKSFIARASSSRYTFSSERDAPQSEICREDAQNTRECLVLQMHSKRLFEAMQNLGFFCALPMDPERTHMECNRIPGE